MAGSEKQIALVTGASRGIGRAIALALAREGRHLLINFRSREEEAVHTLEAVKEAGGSGELLPFDVADANAASKAVEGVIEAHGRVDILVNNAGMRKDMLMIWMKHEDWQEVIDLNLGGFFNLTRPVLKSMLRRRFGRIVSISSTSGQMGTPGQVNYSAAKAGLIGASRALAKEVARRGVTVNVVAPGFIDTDMLDGLPMDRILPSIPARRVGQPQEVAAAVVYLCSRLAGYTTGAVIAVNGGIF